MKQTTRIHSVLFLKINLTLNIKRANNFSDFTRIYLFPSHTAIRIVKFLNLRPFKLKRRRRPYVN
jgi:hypothetical protein